MTERSFSDFTSGIWTNSTSNGVTTYTLTRNLAWTSGDTGISGLASTDYIILGEDTIVDGGGYTITLSVSGHTGIFKIDSSISSINSAPIIQNIEVSAGSGLIAENAGSLIATEQNYFYLYNCTVSGTLSNANSGGLCGSKCCNSVIKNCISTCDLSGNYCGGIVGSNYGYIENTWTSIATESEINSSTGIFMGSIVALSSDATVLAVSGQNNQYGIIKVYEHDGSSWSQKGSDISGSIQNEFLGVENLSLSKDGTIFSAGSWYANSQKGHTKIYKWENNAWTQLGSTISGDTSGIGNHQFSMLSGDGTRIIISAYYYSTGAGRVQVYKWNSTSEEWEQEGSDIEGDSGSYFGSAVSISDDGSIIAVGAKSASAFKGQVKIYEWSGSSWTQKGYNIIGEYDGDSIGDHNTSLKLSLDGTTIAIGSKYNDGSGSSAGHIRVYEWSGSSWTQKGSDIDGDQGNGEKLGTAVAISSDGNIIAVSAPDHDNDSGTSSDNYGIVYVYEWNSSGETWELKGTKIIGTKRGGYFGRESLSLSSDGSTLAIGSEMGRKLSSENSSLKNAGLVQVYESGSESSTNIIEKSFFQPDSGITGDYCGGIIGGYSVSNNFSNTTTILKCFSDGTLDNTSGTVASGGIAGYRAGKYNTLTVSNCFSLNTGVSGTYYAGLLGPESIATVTNCYSDSLIAYNSTLTESNNYDYSDYTTYASSLPTNWSTSIWEATSGNYPRLKAFITDDVWSGNDSDDHASMNYSLSFSEEVVDSDIVSVYITSTERDNVKNETISSDGALVEQLVDFSNIASGNKKSVRHAMLNKLFTNNTSISKLKMTPANLGLNTTIFDKTYIMAFEQGTESTPQINLSTEIDENTGVYANLDNTGDVIEFIDNGGTSITITKKSDGDYDVDDGETVQVASDDTSLVVNYYTIYFGGAGINEGQQLPCFTDTCYLLTPIGYKNVTKLKKDDLVVTADNRKVRIKNIYKTKASSLYRPYLINKGGLGNNLPTVDTYISPEHKLLHNGKWIKPKNTLFKKSWNKSEIVYYHVELPNYKTDNVICNGVVMESWDGNKLL